MVTGYLVRYQRQVGNKRIARKEKSAERRFLLASVIKAEYGWEVTLLQQQYLLRAFLAHFQWLVTLCHVR